MLLTIMGNSAAKKYKIQKFVNDKNLNILLNKLFKSIKNNESIESDTAIIIVVYQQKLFIDTYMEYDTIDKHIVTIMENYITFLQNEFDESDYYNYKDFEKYKELLKNYDIEKMKTEIMYWNQNSYLIQI